MKKHKTIFRHLNFYAHNRDDFRFQGVSEKNKLILVSAITPTPAGEGKTTISIGLSLGLNRIGKKTTVALREPSLGLVFAGAFYLETGFYFPGIFSALLTYAEREFAVCVRGGLFYQR